METAYNYATEAVVDMLWLLAYYMTKIMFDLSSFHTYMQ